MEYVIVLRITAAAVKGGGETVIVRKDKFGGFGNSYEKRYPKMTRVGSCIFGIN